MNTKDKGSGIDRCLPAMRPAHADEIVTGHTITPERAFQLGWSIIPTGVNKKPIIDTWKPFQSRRPTQDEVSQWKALKPATWAMITGEVSSRITLDFDGEKGRKTLDFLGLNPHRRTPSGGFHVDFKSPEWRVKTLNHKSKRELGDRWPGLDIRADGGHVCIAGRTTRGEYTWLRDPSEPPDDLKLLPTDLREFLGLLQSPVAPVKAEDQSHHADGKPHENQIVSIGRVDAERLVCMALDRAAADGRNNTGIWLGCQLRDNGYAFGEAESVMQNYRSRCPGIDTKGQPEPYTEQEMKATLLEAFSRPAREPWTLGKDRPETTAAIPPDESLSNNWKTLLLTSKRGPLGNVANAITALRHAPEWQNVLRFDESALTVVAKMPPPFEYAPSAPFTWTDEHDIQTAAWLQHQDVRVNKEIAGQALQVVAREHSFHPVRDYLDSLKWDGIARIDDWLTLYIGVNPTDYVRAVGAKFLIGGVARVYQPGSKNDACLILEGPQGGLKSTALRTLADPWFTDEIPELGTKDAALQTRGVWLIEIAELDSMTRTDVSRVKAFMSRSVDRFRPPYGKRPIEAPRECIFAGTTNKQDYLKDETGGRREKYRPRTFRLRPERRPQRVHRPALQRPRRNDRRAALGNHHGSRAPHPPASPSRRHSRVRNHLHHPNGRRRRSPQKIHRRQRAGREEPGHLACVGRASSPAGRKTRTRR